LVADIAIEFTGLRPGEKLTETLIDEGETVTPCVPGITEIRSDWPEDAIDGLDVAKLETLSRTGDAGAVRDLIGRKLAAIRDRSRGSSPAFNAAHNDPAASGVRLPRNGPPKFVSRP